MKQWQYPRFGGLPLWNDNLRKDLEGVLNSKILFPMEIKLFKLTYMKGYYID